MVNEAGISAIKLIFTVIILIAIIVAAVFVIGKLVETSHVTDIKTDLLYIQAKCKVLHDKKVVDDTKALLGEEINEFPENDIINQIVAGEDKWYRLSQDNLNEIGVGYLNAEEGFIVNYDTEEVIYAKGVQEEGEETYYKLSDMVKEDEQEEEQTENEEPEQQVENTVEEQQTEEVTNSNE